MAADPASMTAPARPASSTSCAPGCPGGCCPPTSSVAAPRTAQSINRLEACLTNRCDPGDVEPIHHAAGRLRRLQRVRSALQHAGRHNDLIRDLAVLGIAWPPADWAAAWERIRGEAADALGVFRDETRALAEGAA
jgi:hypothetical protein